MNAIDALATCKRDHLQAMMDAAGIVSETMRVLQKSGTNVVGEILKTSDAPDGAFRAWDHLPPADVYDRDTHSQYYYHAHARAADGTGPHDDEHGHFHTFIRGKGMRPRGIEPVPLPDYDADTDITKINTHVIGIAMTPFGTPFRLFTVNRWVTGETWVTAEDVIRLIDGYAIDQIQPSWPANLWITNMIILFRPVIERLIRERDLCVADWQARHPDTNVYEDRGLEVTSQAVIDLAAYVDALEAALNKAAAIE